MRLTSDLFQDNGPIPPAYTCKGPGTSPSLHISDTPAEAVSLALVMHDPDAPRGDFVHWLVWNIDPATSFIEEGMLPATSRQGVNGFGTIGYGGPCPPSGTHRYVFELYALNALLDVPEGADRTTLEAALEQRIVTTARLTGLVSA
jgi:Raf kinase inhibitor-like YbhB/YbcL family protein